MLNINCVAAQKSRSDVMDRSRLNHFRFCPYVTDQSWMIAHNTKTSIGVWDGDAEIDRGAFLECSLVFLNTGLTVLLPKSQNLNSNSVLIPPSRVTTLS